MLPAIEQIIQQPARAELPLDDDREAWEALLREMQDVVNEEPTHLEPLVEYIERAGREPRAMFAALVFNRTGGTEKRVVHYALGSPCFQQLTDMLPAPHPTGNPLQALLDSYEDAAFMEANTRREERGGYTPANLHGRPFGSPEHLYTWASEQTSAVAVRKQLTQLLERLEQALMQENLHRPQNIRRAIEGLLEGAQVVNRPLMNTVLEWEPKAVQSLLAHLSTPDQSQYVQAYVLKQLKRGLGAQEGPLGEVDRSEAAPLVDSLLYVPAEQEQMGECPETERRRVLDSVLSYSPDSGRETAELIQILVEREYWHPLRRHLHCLSSCQLDELDDPQLLELLEHDDPELRNLAMRGLGRTQQQEQTSGQQTPWRNSP